MSHTKPHNWETTTSLSKPNLNKMWASTDSESWENQSRSYKLVSSTTEFKQASKQNQLESSTKKKDYSKELYEEFFGLFKANEEQNFEDGMESEFSQKLTSLVKKYEDESIEIITSLIIYETVNAETASEALRWLGKIEHAPSYRFRLWLLERSLSCSKARIRDGAILGLSFLNDPHAISYIKLAIKHEKCTELREDMKQVLAQLESISQCHFY